MTRFDADLNVSKKMMREPVPLVPASENMPVPVVPLKGAVVPAAAELTPGPQRRRAARYLDAHGHPGLAVRTVGAATHRRRAFAHAGEDGDRAHGGSRESARRGGASCGRSREANGGDRREVSAARKRCGGGRWRSNSPRRSGLPRDSLAHPLESVLFRWSGLTKYVRPTGSPGTSDEAR
jgi:hypothetical protein